MNPTNTEETKEVEEDFLECDDCSIKNKTVEEIYDRLLCIECQDSYRDCELCSERIHEDNLYRCGRMGQVCDSCRDTLYICENCDDYYDENELASISMDTLCEVCCGERDDEYGYPRPDYRDVKYTQALEVYGKARQRGKIIKSPRKFGVEFEIVPNRDDDVKDSKFRYTKDFDIWGIHNDGSLNDGGIEVVTPPMRLKKGEDDLTLFSKNAKKNNWTTDESCGTHVHIDAPEFKEDPKMLRRLVLSYILLDKAILMMLPRSRRLNGYCSPLNKDNAVLGKAHSSSDIGYTLGDFIEANTMSKIRNLIYKTKTPNELERQLESHYSNNRYYGINFHSLWNRGYNTVEIRYHQGTIDSEVLIPWIAFHQHVLDNARKIDDKKAILLKSIKNPVDRLVAYALHTDMDRDVLNTMIKRINKYKTKKLCVE